MKHGEISPRKSDFRGEKINRLNVEIFPWPVKFRRGFAAKNHKWSARTVQKWVLSHNKTVCIQTVVLSPCMTMIWFTGVYTNSSFVRLTTTVFSQQTLWKAITKFKNGFILSQQGSRYDELTLQFKLAHLTHPPPPHHTHLYIRTILIRIMLSVDGKGIFATFQVTSVIRYAYYIV